MSKWLLNWPILRRNINCYYCMHQHHQHHTVRFVIHSWIIDLIILLTWHEISACVLLLFFERCVVGAPRRRRCLTLRHLYPLSGLILWRCARYFRGSRQNNNMTSLYNTYNFFNGVSRAWFKYIFLLSDIFFYLDNSKFYIQFFF